MFRLMKNEWKKISMSRFVPQMWYLFLEKAGPICSKNFGMSLA